MTKNRYSSNKEDSSVLRPRELFILGHVYSLNYEDNLCRDDGRVGESNCCSATITIDDSLSTSMREGTFIHEILEQGNYLLQLDLEHEQLNRMAEFFHCVMKQNPDIFGEMTL